MSAPKKQGLGALLRSPGNIAGMQEGDPLDDAPGIATSVDRTGGVTAPPQYRSKPKNVVVVKASLCRMWKYHDRSPEWYTAERCADVIDSMREMGQQSPALGRYLKDDPDGKVIELIFGGRRRFSAEHIGIDLEVEITRDDDLKCYKRMVGENDDRENLSFIEKALRNYRRDADKFFPNREMHAAVEKVDKGTLSRLIRVGELFDKQEMRDVLPDILSVTRNTATALVEIITTVGEAEAISAIGTCRAKFTSAKSDELIKKAILQLKTKKTTKAGGRVFRGQINKKASYQVSIKDKGGAVIELKAAIGNITEDEFILAMKDVFKLANKS